MIRAIVFDCFGVLYEDALKQLVDHHAEGDTRRAQEYYAVLAAHNHGFIGRDEYYKKLSALSGETPEAIERRLNDTTVFSQAVASVVASLKPTYKTGLLSNAERSFLDRFLAEHNARQLFDVVLASSETPFMKPQREIFVEVARRLGVELSEILLVDDSSKNTAGAKRCGLSVITYKNPKQLSDELAAIAIPKQNLSI
jgi:HAD superfamily hydrolase (TIGR01509 family)